MSLFDFNAIVAAVGGSMGLFLGFSFLECGLAAQRFFQANWFIWSSQIKQKGQVRDHELRIKENSPKIKFVKHFSVSRGTQSSH